MKSLNLGLRPRSVLGSAATATVLAIVSPGQASALDFASCSPGVAGSCTSLTAGDKKIERFSFLNFTPSVGDTISIQELIASSTYQIQYNLAPSIQGNTTPGLLPTFSYTLSVLSLDQVLDTVKANITGNTTTPPGFFSTTIFGGGASSTANSAPPGPNPGPVSSFVGDLTTVFLTQNLTATGGDLTTISSVGAVVDQRTKVPGPLPLLGAGTAFAFSRKLRVRIRQSV